MFVDLWGGGGYRNGCVTTVHYKYLNSSISLHYYRVHLFNKSISLSPSLYHTANCPILSSGSIHWYHNYCDSEATKTNDKT